MKKITVSICLLLTTLLVYGQCVTPAKIVDKDGYVNVRQGANFNSKVVGTLDSGTKVYYEYSESSSWYKISLSSAGKPMGYIHSSRLSQIWTMSAYIGDPNDTYTNIRTAPSGNVAFRLPTDDMYLAELSECKNGWWHIESITHIIFDDYSSEKPIVLPQTGVWVHTSCISTDMSGDGTRAYSLYSAPNKGASIIKRYPGGTEEGFIAGILDLSADKKFVKIKTNDGKIGWVTRDMLCCNPYSTCE